MPDEGVIAHSGRSKTPLSRVAAGVLIAESLLLLALIAAYAIGIREDIESDLGRTLASIALFLVGVVILLTMARGWLRGQSWPKMATLVVNALLVPVSFTVISTWGAMVGIPLLALAVLGVLAGLSASSGDGSNA